MGIMTATFQTESLGQTDEAPYWCWARGRDPSCPVAHTHPRTGTAHAGGLARCHGRGHAGSFRLAHMLGKQVPKRTEGENMGPFLNF